MTYFSRIDVPLLLNYSVVIAISLLLCPGALQAQADTLSRFYQLNRYILLDDIEEVHLQLQGEEAPMIPYRKDLKYGFALPGHPDSIIIEPQFDQVFAIYPEGAVVREGDDGFGLISITGEWLIEPYCSQLLRKDDHYHGIISHVSDSISLQQLPEFYNSYHVSAYFDLDGELLFYENAHDFSTFNKVDTLAWFRYGSYYTIRGKSGHIHKKLQWQEDERFVCINNNLLWFSYPDSSAYGQHVIYKAYALNGQLRHQLNYYGPASFFIQLNPNLFLVGEDSWRADIVDSTGQELDDIVYHYDGIDILHTPADYYAQNYFRVTQEIGEAMGLMDRYGNMILPLEYSHVGEPVDGWVFTIAEGDYPRGSFINIHHQERRIGPILDTEDLLMYYKFVFHQPLQFTDGRLLIRRPYHEFLGEGDNDIARYIETDQFEHQWLDTNLQVILTLDTSYAFVGLPSEGLIPAATTDGKLGFIDQEGQWVISPVYSMSYTGEYPMPILVIPIFKGGYAYLKAFHGYIDRHGRQYFSGELPPDEYDFSH